MNRLQSSDVASLAAALFAAALLATTLAAPEGARAYGFPEGQAKINYIDVSEAPTIKIHVSFLDRRQRPVPLKNIRTIEVSRHEDGSSRGDEVIRFVDLLPEGEKEGEVLLFSKSGAGRDVALVVAGHQHPEMRDGELGRNQLQSLGIFFKKLTGGRLNVIWYTERLRTYVQRSEKQGELSDLVDALPYCDEKRLESYEYWGMAPPEPEEGEEPEPADPCGPIEDFGKLEEIVKGLSYRGFYPDLMGYDGLEPCMPPAHLPQEARPHAAGRRSDAAPTAHGGAIDEAFRMLVRSGSLDEPKYLILLSDGKDGYLNAQEDCRLKYVYDARKDLEKLREGCKAQTRGWSAYRACLREIDYAKKERGVKDKAEKELQLRVSAEQQRFRDQRLGQWLALAHAANVVVHAVGYPTGLPAERERLEILAYKTGGTYREIEEATSLADAYSDLVDEIANQYVIVFDAGVKAEETATFSVRMTVAGAGSFGTAPFSVHVPEVLSGFAALKAFALDKFHWLESKVGSPWHIVIVVVAAILALLLVILLFKLIIGLFKKIFGKGAKKAAGMAKKGGGGMPRVPSGMVRR